MLWIDYFNSTHSREQGRRTPVSKSVKDPTLEELAEAAKRLGYNPVQVVAKFPSRMTIPSGFVSVEKKTGEKKSKVISDFAKMMSIVRGEKTAALSSKKR